MYEGKQNHVYQFYYLLRGSRDPSDIEKIFKECKNIILNPLELVKIRQSNDT